VTSDRKSDGAVEFTPRFEFFVLGWVTPIESNPFSPSQSEAPNTGRPGRCMRQVLSDGITGKKIQNRCQRVGNNHQD
jgi:hypothetical protein